MYNYNNKKCQSQQILTVKMKSTKAIKFFYYILKFCCLIPFNLNLNTFEANRTNKSIIWLIIFSGSFLLHEIFIGNFAYKFQTHRIKENSQASYYQYTDLFIPAFILFLICIIWTCLRNDLTFKIIERSKLIHQRIKSFDVPWKYECKINQFVYKFVLTQLLSLLVDYIFFIQHRNNSLVLTIVYVPIIGMKFVFVSAILMKFDILLIILESSFSHLNIIIIEKFIKNKASENDDRILEGIEELTQIYFNLCKIYEMITKLFSIPLILCVGFIFIVVEREILQLYGNFYEDKRISRILCASIWNFIRVRDVFLVFKDGTCVLQKVRD